MTEPLKRFKPNTKMVPVPSRSIIPERDVNHSPVLEASHLGIEFGGLKAVDDVNLAIGRTEICGLIGPNGAGKTTVFNLLTKVYQPTTGTVLINGKDTAGMNTVQASKLGIARTFQNIRLFDNMTVEENVRIGLHNQIKYGMFSGIFRLPQYWQGEKKQHEKALDLLEQEMLSRGRLVSLQVSGNKMTVAMSGMSLDQISRMFDVIQQSPIVSNVELNLASTEDGNVSTILDFTVRITLRSAEEADK